MVIYSTKNYRKIWEQYNGPIPKDEYGRTYDIHHIDGDHNNNDPKNLLAVSIDEHYDIHFSKGDYYACVLIELRRKQKPELISFLASENAKKLVEEGRHNLLKKPDGSSVAKESAERRVKEGTHNFQTRPDGSSVSKENTERRVKEGTHQFLTRPDGTSVASDRVEAGTHPLQTRPDGSSVGKESNEKRVKDGTHNLLKRDNGTSVASDRVEAGTHNWLKQKGTVACYNKSGEYKRIPKEQFYSQRGPKEDWEWMTLCSKEGKKRKNQIVSEGIR